MANRDTRRVRDNGLHYTPTVLAQLLADRAIAGPVATVFDPACGEGALLAAAVRRCAALNGAASGRPSVYGCDLLMGKVAKNKLPHGDYVARDFLSYRGETEYDLILMNPPFISARMMTSTARRLHNVRWGSVCPLSSNADMWAYFLLKATSHLNKGGRIGAILPWSFLQADYARNLRRWLATRFRRIRVLMIGAKCFEETNQRVLLLWLDEFGRRSQSIRVGFTEGIQGKHTFSHISLKDWCNSSALSPEMSDVESLLSIYTEEHGFSRLQDLADIRIGVVTGADEFFIMTRERAKTRGFHHKNLVPILTTARELSNLVIEAGHSPTVLLRLSKNHPGRHTEYLREGVERGFDQRSHSRRREPWFGVGTGPVPHGFFPYRVSWIPFMALNEGRLQCTNSVHRVYFKDIPEEQRRWVQMSLLSVPGQLSLEAYSKVYGNGMLKVEPRSLKRAIAHSGEGAFPGSVYDRVRALIESGDKEAAMMAATRFLDNELGLPTDVSQRTEARLRELQSRRMGN